MIVLVLLLSLLGFAFPEGQVQTPTDTPSSALDAAQKAQKDSLELIKQTYGLTSDQKRKTCDEIASQIASLAGKYGWMTKNGVISLPGNYKEYYGVSPDCQVSVSEIKGSLSSARDLGFPTSLSGALPGEQKFTPVSGLSLFKTLFQLLMYFAGIYWVFHIAKNFIAGELPGAFASFLQGLILLSVMFWLYKLM
ncbi:MAG: hypothetical protein QW212_01065 [Nitrososphaerales archaeon]